ncbi:MAG: ATP-binding protein [Bryobacteraceae bacterium]|nr:ATP-binding protein [Bryobacteraceae bacterium]
MASRRLEIQRLGPIREADVRLGDLTVLVGPQASGKSIFLETLKLALDSGPVKMKLEVAGFDWGKDERALADLFYGEGMRSIWQRDTEIRWQGKETSLKKLAAGRYHNEKCFYIPAQRVLAFSREGWFRPFSEFRPGDPFVVREFSDKIRMLVEGESGALFPQSNRLKKEIRDLLQRGIFGEYRLEVAKSGAQKRVVMKSGEGELPFMVWSTGQREFIPLLLGLYQLMPPAKRSRHKEIEYVVIEEMEMGLHPQAIEAMLFVVLELMSLGYRVCLSTHSVEVLNMVWALGRIQEHGDAADLLNLFRLPKTAGPSKVAEASMRKDIVTYYFDRKGPVKDISGLSLEESIEAGADWGGLTSFASRAAEVVGEVLSR